MTSRIPLSILFFGVMTLPLTLWADVAVPDPEGDGPPVVTETPTPPLDNPTFTVNTIAAIIQQQRQVIRRRIVRRVVRRQVRGVARRQGRRFRPARRRVPVKAGELFESAEIANDYTFASYSQGTRESTGAEDGKGHDWENTTAFTGMLGDSLQLAMSYSVAETDRGGANPFDQRTQGGDINVNYILSDNFAFGAFATFYQADIEDDETDDVWGGGLVLSYNHQVGEFDLGVTTSLASLEDNDSLGDMFDAADASWVTMFDVQRALTDAMSASVYTLFYTKLDNDTPTGTSYDDQTFWSVGADVSYAPNDTLSFSVGYETTLDLARFQDNRINASVAFSW